MEFRPFIYIYIWRLIIVKKLWRFVVDDTQVSSLSRDLEFLNTIFMCFVLLFMECGYIWIPRSINIFILSCFRAFRQFHWNPSAFNARTGVCYWPIKICLSVGAHQIFATLSIINRANVGLHMLHKLCVNSVICWNWTHTQSHTYSSFC